MNEVHGHEVMQLMIDSGMSFTKDQLIIALENKFGDASYYTCSQRGMNSGEIIDHLEQKGKFAHLSDGFVTDSTKICSH